MALQRGLDSSWRLGEHVCGLDQMFETGSRNLTLSCVNNVSVTEIYWAKLNESVRAHAVHVVHA